MQKFYQPLTWLILLSLLVAAMYELVTQSWSDFFVVIQAILLSSIPYILKRRYNIHTPALVRFGIVLFLFATLFLGEIRHFYQDIWWWDFALHTLAGTGLMLISFLLLVTLYRESELRSTPFMTVLLAFSFTMMMSVTWEIYEFTIDQFWKQDDPMQPSNFDTMTDFIAAVLGSIVVAVPGYQYLRRDYYRKSLVSDVVQETKEEN